MWHTKESLLQGTNRSELTECLWRDVSLSLGRGAHRATEIIWKLFQSTFLCAYNFSTHWTVRQLCSTFKQGHSTFIYVLCLIMLHLNLYAFVFALRVDLAQCLHRFLLSLPLLFGNPEFVLRNKMYFWKSCEVMWSKRYLLHLLH